MRNSLLFVGSAGHFCQLVELKIQRHRHEFKNTPGMCNTRREGSCSLSGGKVLNNKWRKGRPVSVDIDV